ncbi:MAG: limonene-1,2-epoxide hydrolase family protein [Acidimicrobiales bacterium]
MTPSEVVNAFISAIERKDIAGAAALLAEDVSYENMPTNPITGKAATVATLEAFLGPATEVDWPIKRQLAAGNTVVNERLDRFKIGDGWLELPVAGVFEVNEAGLIVLWRDYFDMPTYMSQIEALSSKH